MNTTYASPPRDMHPRSTMPSIHDPAYRSAPTHTNSQYSIQPHAMPPILPQHSQIAAYEQYNNTLPTSRPPLEHLSSQEALNPFPGTHSSEPIPRSIVENGRKYELMVVQQPCRARMCGFGDKDRRPITPPPCVRLIITDIKSGKEVDINEIDYSMYVLNVDLWSADGTQEVNLVRHASSSPSISATVPVSYAQVESGIYSGQPTSPQYGNAPTPYQGNMYNPYPGPPQVNAYSQQPQPGQQPPYGGNQYQSAYPAHPANGGNGNYPPSNGYQQQVSQQSQSPYYSQSQAPYLGLARGPVSNTNPTGMFTRNLIGSLSASAFRLADPDDRIGIWFVLQDLSVRTEADFRLRFSFVNVGPPSMTSPNANQSCAVNTGKAPILASCFSDVFKVYSAKKFPGVVESTPLSKCFAIQGIKIPIRKDGQGKGGKDGRGGDDYGDED